MKKVAYLNLSKLTCIKSQEQVDEPYLWAFYFKLDGTNIAQDINYPLEKDKNYQQAKSNIKIETSVSSGGTLPSNLSTGQSLSIPPSIGEFSATLTDIPIVGFGNPLIIPGMIGCLVALIEQDAVPPYAMEDAHQAVRGFFEQKVNMYIEGLRFPDVIDGARKKANKKPGEKPTPEEIKTYIQSEIEKLKKNFTTEIIDIIISTVLDSMTKRMDFGNMLAAISDRDDRFGVKTVFFNTTDLMNKSITHPITLEFKGTGEEYNYSLTGYAHLELKPQPPELHQISKIIRTDVTISHIDTVNDPLCLKKPVKTRWTKYGNKEEYDIWWHVMPGYVRWTIFGINFLSVEEGDDPDIDTITPLVSTWDPVFNGNNAPGFYDMTFSNRRVKLGYEIFRINGVPHIKLTNDPADGNYSLLIVLDLFLPNKMVVRVDQVSIDFDGAYLTIADDLRQSLENCHNIEKAKQASFRKRSSIFHKVSLNEMWGPYYRTQLQNSIAEKLNAYAAKNQIHAVVIERALLNLRQELEHEIPNMTAGDL